MSRRRDLEHHRDSLREIGEILGSMKTLAYMETRKLSRFISAQRSVVESIRDAAADFLSFHAGSPDAKRETTPVYLVVGSERGFCGDFNRTLAERLDAKMHEHDGEQPRVVALGHKLHSLIDTEDSAVMRLAGASVAEEIPGVMQSIISALDSLRADVADLALFGIYHEAQELSLSALLPPFGDLPREAPPHPEPPLLNVPPEAFFAELVEHYLFAELNHMLYASLMSENERRVSHLERAVRRLDEQSGELTRKCRALRQEEIIEEIEVILLNASGAGAENEPPTAGQHRDLYSGRRG